MLAYMGLIFALSEMKTPPGAEQVWDKVLHVGAYGVLGVLGLRALHGGSGRLRWKPSLAALALTIGYGASDELHQSFVDGRTASLGDVAADAVGAVLALAALAVLTPFFASPSRRSGIAEVTLVERVGCPKCREALGHLEEVRREISFRLVRRDVDRGKTARVFDGETVPLVFLDGKVLFRGEVDPGRLRSALRGGGSQAEWGV